MLFESCLSSFKDCFFIIYYYIFNKSIYFIEEEKIGIDNDETKEGHLTNNGKRIIPKWKRKRMEAIKAKKQRKLPEQ